MKNKENRELITRKGKWCHFRRELFSDRFSMKSARAWYLTVTHAQPILTKNVGIILALGIKSLCISRAIHAISSNIPPIRTKRRSIKGREIFDSRRPRRAKSPRKKALRMREIVMAHNKNGWLPKKFHTGSMIEPRDSKIFTIVY